jgi:hypothetical protein
MQMATKNIAAAASRFFDEKELKQHTPFHHRSQVLSDEHTHAKR